MKEIGLLIDCGEKWAVASQGYTVPAAVVTSRALDCSATSQRRSTQQWTIFARNEFTAGLSVPTYGAGSSQPCFWYPLRRRRPVWYPVVSDNPARIPLAVTRGEYLLGRYAVRVSYSFTSCRCVAFLFAVPIGHSLAGSQ